MTCRRMLGTIVLMSLVGPGAAVRAQELSEDALARLELRAIGPAVMGGRINDLAVDEQRPWVMYVGAASGGLWKTTNNGTTWTPIFDDQAVASIGDVTLAPSDPEIVWVGTGEANNRQSTTFGNGVYKSTDGGASWEHVGLEQTHHIGRIVIHPSDPATVYVAGGGHLWGANPERGVFKTSDGGNSWDKVLFIDADTGVSDLAMDPVNPRILYATAYQRRRTPWGFSGDGGGSGMYKTTDGGETWRVLTEGLPEGTLGRIGLDIHRADPRIVYATVQHADGGIFRSEDRGEHWTRVNELNPRAMYYSQIRVDPTDDRRVYVLGGSFNYSDDGGETWVQNTDMTPTYDIGVHGDHHALWIDPAHSEHLILGGDGGLYFSWDASITWDKVNNIPLAQFYAIGVDMQTPYWVYGGAQDTHSWGGPSATRTQIGILNSDWLQINFGDGMYQQVDPTDPNTVYTESQGGAIVRFDRASGDRRTIKPYPADGDEEYRFHWTTPIAISPHDANRIYVGGNRLFTSTDRGETWSASEDLTRAEDRDTLPIMDEVPDEETLSRHDGVSEWGTITTIAESPVAPGLMYVGTDDGLVQISRDEGQTWTSQAGRFPGLDEERTLVSRVAASRADAGRAYVSFDRHQLDDLSPYVFTTDDYGGSWRSIASDLPEAGWINVVAEHPDNPNLLFVGTETGVFVSFDRGGAWTGLRGNFPTVPVDDLVIHPRDYDLVVGTHGRGIYILDDITPLAQLSSDVIASDAHLFDVREVTEFLQWKHESYGAQRQFVGSNPPYGAIISYYLGRAAADAEPPALTILDPTGRDIRRIDGTGNAGMNRVVWDLRADYPESLDEVRGPLVPPGRYRARLEAGGMSRETPIDVTVDARVTGISTADHRARYELLRALNEIRGTIAEAVTRTEEIDDQVEALMNGADADLPGSVETAADEVIEETRQIRERLRGSGTGGFGGGDNLRSLAGRLYGELDGVVVQQGTFGAPTVVQRDRMAALTRDLDDTLMSLNRLIETTIPALNTTVGAAGVNWIRPGRAIRRD